MFGGTIPPKRLGKKDMGGHFLFLFFGNLARPETPAHPSLASGLGSEVYGDFQDLL